ncbi:related to VPS25 Vacuolar protein sorting (putative) [Ramularia collo-cygni]|uniref:Related to VPS25 Vacuolar protein sorting (Putative) n=1 Tax=Ramularia collo-cygni TaxID=112498 RepID=A0A2D3UTN7_9PEZI|nr:related to VPS25 Vacuolar protein sorting (putative) [Ramularia collo-cygni]CZT17305.1 related to VPS25 Vacuolar protein sorting (putative) [Ramularia collo-cygni]
MSVPSPASQSLAALSISSPSEAQPPPASDLRNIRSYPPFYTLQPNLTIRARQLELWSSLITSYCATNHIFRLSLSSPPPDLFSNTTIKRSLKAADIKTVLESMGKTIEWLSADKSACLVWWRSAEEWADALVQWVEGTGQKGAVLTVYELRETGDWRGMEEVMLRKVLTLLAKKGKAAIFAVGDGEGVKFF